MYRFCVQDSWPKDQDAWLKDMPKDEGRPPTCALHLHCGLATGYIITLTLLVVLALALEPQIPEA